MALIFFRLHPTASKWSNHEEVEEIDRDLHQVLRQQGRPGPEEEIHPQQAGHPTLPEQECHDHIRQVQRQVPQEDSQEACLMASPETKSQMWRK